MQQSDKRLAPASERLFLNTSLSSAWWCSGGTLNRRLRGGKWNNVTALIRTFCIILLLSIKCSLQEAMFHHNNCQSRLQNNSFENRKLIRAYCVYRFTIVFVAVHQSDDTILEIGERPCSCDDLTAMRIILTVLSGGQWRNEQRAIRVHRRRDAV